MPALRPLAPPSRSRVLVVEDEPGVVSFAARALRAKGFDVDVASGRDEALALLRVHRYDVVLLDLRMPATNGIVVLRHVMDLLPEQKVVVVLAAADTKMKARCLELGAAELVAKPFELAELVARVAAHARRAPVTGLEAADGERTLRVGRIELDLDGRTVDAGAGPVELPGREFMLLRYLMRRAGEPCSREELLREVWDMPFDPRTNLVDAYVHRLRRKLVPGAIKTVRGLGYRLVG